MIEIDFHAHILPGCDHGSDGWETSRQQLKLAREAVKNIPPGNILVAVPHEATPFRDNLRRVLACRHYLASDEAAKHPAQTIARIRDMMDNGTNDGFLAEIRRICTTIGAVALPVVPRSMPPFGFTPGSPPRPRLPPACPAEMK